MNEPFIFCVGNCTESLAEVHLENLTDSQILSVTGEVVGPFCQFARTLPATFPISSGTSSTGLDAWSGDALIIDPCYWTPELPLLYEIHCKTQMTDGREIEMAAKVGLKRWAIHGPDWNLEGRRKVFRGAAMREESDEFLSSARESEIALLASTPGESMLTSASRIGVPLLVDFRGAQDEQEFDRLSWSPAVMATLHSYEQLGVKPVCSWPRQSNSFLGMIVPSRSRETDFPYVECDFYAAEIHPGERPPAWLNATEKPVIVIRRGEEYADFAATRAACDRLQAELAPEFDFAGYFVTS